MRSIHLREMHWVKSQNPALNLYKTHHPVLCGKTMAELDPQDYVFHLSEWKRHTVFAQNPTHKPCEKCWRKAQALEHLKEMEK